MVEKDAEVEKEVRGLARAIIVGCLLMVGMGWWSFSQGLLGWTSFSVGSSVLLMFAVLSLIIHRIT